jgi:Transposase DDE domain
MFANVKLHGNVNWLPRLLIVLAILTAWGSEPQMTESFVEASKLSMKFFSTIATVTYQGMMRALVSYSDQLLPIVWCRFQSLIETASPQHYRIGRWLPLAVDGSRFTTPRTTSNEKAFAAQNFGKGGRGKNRTKWKNKLKRSKKLCQPVKPQIWLTLVWHMGSKLPWCWKTGPSTSSERHHLIDMLRSLVFPENTLFCCDAGFTGYELWSAILASGNHFVIRIGSNVKLLKNLGHYRNGDGIVYLWPDQAARKQQPPIVLRLIEVKGERGSMFLVTSVLDRKALNDSMFKRLYPLRWGVELQFRALKQTFGLGKLRSRNSEHALAELNWSIVALTMIQLLALKEQNQLDIPPEQSSVGQALRAIRNAMRHWYEADDRANSFTARLGGATKDEYERMTKKAARYQANYKDKPTAGKPVVRNATPKQQRDYIELKTAA